MDTGQPIGHDGRHEIGHQSSPQRSTTMAARSPTKSELFPMEWPEPAIRRPEVEYDRSWGKGYDTALNGGHEYDNPYDPETHPLCHDEWLVGFLDFRAGTYSAVRRETKKLHRDLDEWFESEGVRD